MKFAFAVLLFLDVSQAQEQQSIEESRDILLRLAFPPLYNSYPKSCCKLYPGRCYMLLHSNGFTFDSLRGRVTQILGDGWIQFIISNAQFSDQGFYRCTVMGTPIYSDYNVEVKEAANRQTQLTHKTTTKSQGSTTMLLEPTDPVLGQDYSDAPRDPWSFPLPAVVFLAAVICVSSFAALLFCCVRAKQKQSKAKHAESPQTGTGLGGVKQEHAEISTIVYTTVDFKPHQKPTEIYENLRVAKKQQRHPVPQQTGDVEYSTLALHQRS